ncbi:MAG: hypothetical protein NWR72_18150 [Bacteroidia bacterium]|nr:hypothetical protein [Bacteroidia bacterium]
MDLYKIVSQLAEDEFDEVYTGLTQNKADKSARFLKLIREDPVAPDKQFLAQEDITPAAFYVLKSRLNQKIEAYLLNRVGDPNLAVMQRVLNVNDLVFNNPREIAVAALRRLERELLKFDFPYGLMIVYKELQNLHAFDENHVFYKSRYNQQVAYAVAMDKAVDLVVQFFRAFDDYQLKRREIDHTNMIRIMEKVDNINNLYDSHRLYIFKAIVHIFAKLFIVIPDSIRCELEPIETMFENAIGYLDEYNDDPFYQNINILFNFLRYTYHEQAGNIDKAKIFFETLDYKVEELLTQYHFNANTSLFLFSKLQNHIRNKTLPALLNDVDKYIGFYEIEPYRMSFYVNYNTFLSYAYFLNGDFRRAARVLYNLRNDVNLRKYLHAEVETKFFLALSYVMMEDFDLANQLILSLQRSLRKPSWAKWEHGRILLRILSVALGGKPRTRAKNLKVNIDKWNEENVGPYAFLEMLNLEKLFLEGAHST